MLLLQAMEPAGHMEEERCHEDQTIRTIEDASVAGDDGAHIFDAQIPLDKADCEVAELPSDADNQSRKYEFGSSKMGE